MLVLDTNVLSEIIKPHPEESVLNWSRAQPEALIYTTAITQAEMFYGVSLMPKGKRRSAIEDAVEDLFRDKLRGRVLPFDGVAAKIYAEIVLQREKVGRPVKTFDGQIAAIARRNGGSVVTRNTKDFTDCGVKLHNPWDEEPIAQGVPARTAGKR